MQPFLVDVPVCITIWTRPEILRQTFSAVKEAKPSVIFLVSDGPRNEKENAEIQKSRKVVEDIDWECEVHKLYFETNQGMYALMRPLFNFVFDRVDRCIFLEDDILPSVSFFRFCAELLEKYKDDYRITAINGSNELGQYTRREEDYIFTLGNCIAGYALWRRTYELFDENCFHSKTLEKVLQDATKYNRHDKVLKSVCHQYINYRKNPFYGGHPPGGEFYRSFINITQSQLDIVPTKNMITNLGNENGAHASDLKLMPKRIQRLFQQKRYELDFPIKHPEFCVRDYYFESQVFPTAFKLFMEKIEVYCRYIIYHSPKEVVRKIIQKMKNKKEIEK